MVYPVEDIIEEINLEEQFRIYSSSILHSSVNINVEDEPNGYSFSQDNMLKRLTPLKKRKVNAWWILLDSASTVDVFCNPSLLTNIHVVNNVMKVHCNAGAASTNKMGTLEGYGLVWYYSNGIANILSLYSVTSRFHVQYDNKTTDTFIK